MLNVKITQKQNYKYNNHYICNSIGSEKFEDSNYCPRTLKILIVIFSAFLKMIIDLKIDYKQNKKFFEINLLRVY